MGLPATRTSSHCLLHSLVQGQRFAAVQGEGAWREGGGERCCAPISHCPCLAPYPRPPPTSCPHPLQMAVERELALLKKAMEEKFEAQAKDLTAKISALEAGPGSAPGAKEKAPPAKAAPAEGAA